MENSIITPIEYDQFPEIEGQVNWRSPSNIALVKYWGKHGRQLPKNPSLSFTLKNAFTETKITYKKRQKTDQIRVDFTFEGYKNIPFEEKINAYLESISTDFPFLKNLQLRIASENSFPHSAGIASSASSMSALALGICSIEQSLKKEMQLEPLSHEDFLKKASYFARLGSGSASRSVYGKAAVWGTAKNIENSSDEYAISFAEHLHPVFQDFKDDILIVSKAQKNVSSRAGHALMKHHPYAEVRYAHARRNLSDLSKTLQSGDLEWFIQITEDEALTLHALMMMSTPSFILLQPNTLQLIEKIRNFRAETHYPVTFTIDAGPNIHLLYPAAISDKITDFITTELLHYCHQNYYILDEVGNGAIKLE